MHQDPTIKLGVITTSYPLTADSVSGVFIYRLLQHLPPTVKVTVITPAARGSTPQSPSNPGPTLIAVRYAPRRWQVLAHSGGGIPAALSHNRWLYFVLPALLISMLVTALRHAHRFDVLHAHWSINGVIVGLVGKLTRKPVITTVRGSDVNLAVESPIHRLLLRACVSLSDKVVAVSDSLIATVRKLHPNVAKQKFDVIANGVDDHLFTIKRSAATEKRVLELITVGNLTANKGMDIVVQALSMLSDQRFRLQVVGDGPERQNLAERVASLDLKRQVEFLGAVAPDKIADHLAHADIFVLASRSEGRPNAVLEAMASGLAVVVSDIPGIRDIITPHVNGLLFQKGNPSSLANCLTELARDPALRNKIGASARAFIVSNGFQWSDTATRYCRLYREILAGKHPGTNNQ